MSGEVPVSESPETTPLSAAIEAVERELLGTEEWEDTDLADAPLWAIRRVLDAARATVPAEEPRNENPTRADVWYTPDCGHLHLSDGHQYIHTSDCEWDGAVPAEGERPDLRAAAQAVVDFDWRTWERGDLGTVVMRRSDLALLLAIIARLRDALAAHPVPDADTRLREALREAIDYARLSPNGERRKRWEAALSTGAPDTEEPA